VTLDLPAALQLVLVTDDALIRGRDPLLLCQAAVRGGCTMVQLRLKQWPDRELLALARALVSTLTVPVLVNDRLDIAKAADAAGVHLGWDDLAPALARRQAARPFAIGSSVGNMGEVARGEPADYWGIGPIRATATKADAGTALGLDGALPLLGAAAGRPCVAIGGVVPGDIAALRHAGFTGVAVASGILGADDVESAARGYAAALELAR
jgi:thiamine-phosphate pyrophosphorylase